jgi:CheY-like chemotaxis protein
MSDLLSLLFIGINEEDRLTFLYSLDTHYTIQADATATGASASELLQSHHYHLIVAAAKLPDGSGLDWLQARRANGFTGPVLLLSPQQEETQDLGHLKILLAEDNTINQVLIRKVVTDGGYDLHSAENGLQALALFRQNHYDVILMDMQMPEMDGYEAMAAIRQSPAPESATPIIALTAHASKQEADKGLQAGADLYVSKPFKPEKLLADIAGLLQKKPQLNLPVPAAASPLAAAAPEKKYINLAYLQELGEGDIDFMTDILSMFLEQTPENIKNLQQMAAAQKWQQVKALAHKMKSSVVMIGNKQLEEIFTHLEVEALSDLAAVKIPPLIDQATELCAGAIAAIKAELQNLS